MDTSFHQRFVELFDAEFHRVFRCLDRLSGDPELAADVAQDAFVRLYRRGSLPDAPTAWLISVAMNLFRNERARHARRRRLLTVERGERAMAEPVPSPHDAAAAGESRDRVRAALDRLAERERQLLLLRAEGYAYADIARALQLNEASVGTLLARAKRAFRQAWEEPVHAPR
jgi:RNA polymerase sigma factor (sigma-70 family)